MPQSEFVRHKKIMKFGTFTAESKVPVTKTINTVIKGEQINTPAVLPPTIQYQSSCVSE